MDYQLLEQLCRLQATSGNEGAVQRFIIEYVSKHSEGWKARPEIFAGGEWQECVILKWGLPNTAIFAHMDNIGYTVRYNNQVIAVGAPDAEEGTLLLGSDGNGEIETELMWDQKKQQWYVSFHRAIEPGTPLCYKPHWRETKDYVQCCYLDNRMGVFNALKVAENLEHGLIAFTCYEEHGGGSAANVARCLFEKWGIRQALISDITWVTDGVKAGNGVAISLRDRGIPRRSYVQKIVALAKESGIPFQLEVEESGGSDGTELQKSPYPLDWCFVGAAEENVHTPNEKVAKHDFETMLRLYEYLMKKL